MIDIYGFYNYDLFKLCLTAQKRHVNIVFDP